jgi:hypothetical protein
MQVSGSIGIELPIRWMTATNHANLLFWTLEEKIISTTKIWRRVLPCFIFLWRLHIQANIFCTLPRPYLPRLEGIWDYCLDIRALTLLLHYVIYQKKDHGVELPPQNENKLWNDTARCHLKLSHLNVQYYITVFKSMASLKPQPK